MRDFNVTKVTNGYIVHCGCMTLVFNDRREMVSEIGRYTEHPNAVEREYVEKYGAQPMAAPCEVPIEPPQMERPQAAPARDEQLISRRR